LPVTHRYGPLDLLALANTRHGPAGHWFARPRPSSPDHDHLEDAADGVHWLVDHGVAVPPGLPSPAQLNRLRLVRDLVHGLADQPLDPWTEPVRTMFKEARFTLAPPGAMIATAQGWDGFVQDLLPPLIELVGLRLRIRRCRNPLCRFTFVDHSRAQNRLWCDPRGCGNRVRVRRVRAKRHTVQPLKHESSDTGSRGA
jgi:hypothetical protein